MSLIEEAERTQLLEEPIRNPQPGFQIAPKMDQFLQHFPILTKSLFEVTGVPKESPAEIYPLTLPAHIPVGGLGFSHSTPTHSTALLSALGAEKSRHLPLLVSTGNEANPSLLCPISHQTIPSPSVCG